MSVADSRSSRTLVISPNWIGDAVMAQPLLQLLRERFPERPIDVLAPPSVASVWRSMVEVDTVIETPFRHGALQLGTRWKLARSLRRRHYAAAYVLPNTLKFALIPWLAGIPQRIGYKGESRHGFINIMHHDDRAVPRPMVAFYAALARPPARDALSVASLPRPSLQVLPESQLAAMTRFALDAAAPLIVFAPGAEFGSAKRWPAAHFAELAQHAMRSDADAQVVLLGSSKDSPVCDEIVAMSPRVRSLAGITSLDDAVALIARAAAVVSNDSGLLHVASALNRPVIALYGPTDPDHAPPFSDVARSLSLRLDCAPCRQRECPLGHHDCLRKLTPAMVWQPLQLMLQPMLEPNAMRAPSPASFP
ncbi:MAG: lipopolysaccharide heptosyltransferase II [Herminiimonas sp.]|nr:lipopolysaccharide heptosyltransferase II [Herminiimonas sp.]